LSGLDLADGRRRVVVTPVDFGDGLELRCPHCSQPCAFREEWRGADIACPFGQCGGPLRVNAFSAGG
jgi:hypothetical protein